MRRGPMAAVILACAALAACIVAVLWRGDARDDRAGSARTPGAEPQAPGVTVTDLTVPGPAAASDVAPGSGSPAAGDGGAEAAGVNRTGSERVPVRRYDPSAGDPSQDAPSASEPWGVLVWAHGGSFVRGGLDMPESDWAARQFAAAGLRVYAVDYALASDSVKAPAPANDVAAVAHWVAEHEEAPLIIGGASAGAHLAVLAALDRAEAADAGEATPARALLLEYPTLHRVQRPDAAIARATEELPARLRFDPDRIAQMYRDYLGEPAAEAVAELAPGGLVAGELARERLAQLPSTVIVNAEADELRASGEQFAEQLAVAGVRVIEYTQSGTTHGYLNRSTESDAALASAQQTIDRFVSGARATLEE